MADSVDEIVDRNLAEVRRVMADACRRSGREPCAVTLVAVTKYVDIAAMEALRRAGVTHVGENRVHLAGPKRDALGDGFTWHMIGNIQRRKAKDVVGLFDRVDAVDRMELAVELDKRSAAIGRAPLPVLLEVNISGEESKHGFSLDDVPRALDETAALGHVRVEGLLTMAPAYDDPEEARPIFAALREAADTYNLPVRSMGMTLDYAVAIEEGATEVRVGSALFTGMEGF